MRGPLRELGVLRSAIIARARLVDRPPHPAPLPLKGERGRGYFAPLLTIPLAVPAPPAGSAAPRRRRDRPAARRRGAAPARTGAPRDRSRRRRAPPSWRRRARAPADGAC